MAPRKPKDLLLAEVAYNTFYGEAPQVFFDDLNPSYQMRWVRAIRSVVSDYRRLKSPPPANGGSQPVRTKAKPEKASKKPKKANGIDREKLDADDKALFTEKRWKDKSADEKHARQRVAYREKVYGHSAQQNATAE